MAGPPMAEIWQTDFGGSRGHEQKNIRPSVIWRDLDHVKMAIVIPFTGSLERENMQHTHLISPSSGNGLDKESVALVFQITSIDKKRLLKKLGVLNKEDVDSIAVLLKDLLRV